MDFRVFVKSIDFEICDLCALLHNESYTRAYFFSFFLNSKHYQNEI